MNKIISEPKAKSRTPFTTIKTNSKPTATCAPNQLRKKPVASTRTLVTQYQPTHLSAIAQKNSFGRIEGMKAAVKNLTNMAQAVTTAASDAAAAAAIAASNIIKTQNARKKRVTSVVAWTTPKKVNTTALSSTTTAKKKKLPVKPKRNKLNAVRSVGGQNFSTLRSKTTTATQNSALFNAAPNIKSKTFILAAAKAKTLASHTKAKAKAKIQDYHPKRYAYMSANSISGNTKDIDRSLKKRHVGESTNAAKTVAETEALINLIRKYSSSTSRCRLSGGGTCVTGLNTTQTTRQQRNRHKTIKINASTSQSGSLHSTSSTNITPNSKQNLSKDITSTTIKPNTFTCNARKRTVTLSLSKMSRININPEVADLMDKNAGQDKTVSKEKSGTSCANDQTVKKYSMRCNFRQNPNVDIPNKSLKAYSFACNELLTSGTKTTRKVLPKPYEKRSVGITGEAVKINELTTDAGEKAQSNKGLKKARFHDGQSYAQKQPRFDDTNEEFGDSAKITKLPGVSEITNKILTYVQKADEKQSATETTYKPVHLLKVSSKTQNPHPSRVSILPISNSTTHKTALSRIPQRINRPKNSSTPQHIRKCLNMN